MSRFLNFLKVWFWIYLPYYTFLCAKITNEGNVPETHLGSIGYFKIVDFGSEWYTVTKNNVDILTNENGDIRENGA